jgi:thiol-disulfide isomerase/thioredoxin
MMHRFNRFARLLVLALACLPALALAGAADVPVRGFDGKAHKLGELVGGGKWTVVAVWASDCPICRAELPQMDFFYFAHKDKDARVVGLSIDGYAGRRAAAKFIEDVGLEFPNYLVDVMELFEIGAGAFVGTPTFYIFSPDGKVVGYQVGPLTQEQAEAFIARKSKAGVGARPNAKSRLPP